MLLFHSRTVQGRIQGEAKKDHGVPFFKKLHGKATVKNRIHSNNLEACGKKCCYFWFYSEVKFLTHFWSLFGRSQRNRYDKGHFRHCPGYCCFCYILLKYVLFEQKLLLQVDISSFLHFGAKSTKTTKNHRFLEKFNIFYIVIPKYKLLPPYVHTKQLHSYQNIILTFAE